MRDLPGPGLEPMSPALAGRFLTTVRPGEPLDHLFKKLLRDFSHCPVVKTLPSNAGGAGSIPGQGAKFPHA